MDEASDVEKRALQMAAGYIAAERRLAAWRWNEPEIPQADEVYLRSLQRTPPLRDAP